MKQRHVIQTGEQFNNYTVLNFSHKGGKTRQRSYYLCKCSCGKEKAVLGSALVLGSIKSCGCERAKKIALTKLPDNHGVRNQIFLGYKRNARKRKLEFDLYFDNFSILIRKPCHYCGVKSSNVKITLTCKEGFPYNGIDRIDSSIGYIITNVVPCCKVCNYAKTNLSLQDFLAWAERIYLFNNNK
jgi:hypothetical protein